MAYTGSNGLVTDFDQEADRLAEQFGMHAREGARAMPGYFLSHITKNRFGHRSYGDDVVHVGWDGKITLYADDAQAYLAATALAARMHPKNTLAKVAP